MIRPAEQGDITSICSIYNYYVLNTCVTFEEEAVSVSEMTQRISEILEKYPWLVYEEGGKVIGYAYASAWKSRCAYKFSVETTIYLENGRSAKGIGTKLYSELLKILKEKKLHGIIGGVALPNDACIALHEKLVFEKVAHFKEVGHKFNKWIDVTYWEKILTP